MGREPSAKRKPIWLTGTATALLLLGLSSSIYLTHLFVKVRSGDAATVDSFCAVSEGFNCVTVATSAYSEFLGIPVAVYGVEYFAIALLVVLASHSGLLGLRRWDSLLFDTSVASLPFCGLLAWISATQIRSMCVMCILVYGVNVALVVLLGARNRSRLVEFATEGPRELARWVSEPPRHVVAALLALLALSQVLWLPRFTGTSAQAEAAPIGSMAGVEPPEREGIWHNEPVAGQTLGPANAAIRIEEFTDFQCPFCGRAHRVMLEVVARYPGKIHLIHRDFPLDHHCNPSIPQPFHPDACKAAYFARCAADQNAYWPFEQVLFANQRALTATFMLSAAAKLKLDSTKMRSCVGSPGTHAAVLQDIKEGMDRGIRGTPTVFLNGESIVGAHPVEFWAEKIEAILHAKKPAAVDSNAASAAVPPSAAPPKASVNPEKPAAKEPRAQ